MQDISAGHLLSDFLKAKRAELRPGEVGLSDGPGARRTPGLRRAEVAQLAGISEEWYTQFEMGRSRAMTPRLVEPVATALRLNDAERAYVGDLVAGLRAAEPRDAASALSWSFDHVEDLAVLAYDRRMDLISLNPCARVLFGLGADPTARNALVDVFRSPRVRRMYGERWEAHARLMVGVFRRNLAGDPGDRRARSVIADLHDAPEFVRLWEAQIVHSLAEAAHAERHPLRFEHARYGAFDVHRGVLGIPGSRGGFVELLSPADATALRMVRTIVAVAVSRARSW